ncbi:MAG: hypothetical protein EAZ08_08675 [Cytophagales bacterium]|nr:MAG: hypothetical protein EAZ08_08675 [Cytophagales bacterium]
MIERRNFFLFLSLFLQINVYAQFSPNQLLVYQEVLQLKTQSATVRLSQEDEKSATTSYLQSYLFVLQLLASQDDSLFQANKQQEDEFLEKIRKTPKKTPNYYFLQAEIKIQWALVKLMFGENLSAAWSIKQAYDLLIENQRLYPKFLPTNKSLGLIHIGLGSVPEKYQWFLYLVGLEGDISKGIKEMQTVIVSDSPFSLETQMLFMLAQTYILHEPEKALTEMQTTDPNSLLFQFIHTLASMKAGKQIGIEHIPNNKEYLYSPLFDFLKGEISLLSGNYEQAISFYQLFLKNYKGRNYIKTAYYRLFLAAWLSKKITPTSYLDLCQQKGQAQIESDKNAQDFATKRQLPNPTLMQARLFTDGGAYEKAWEIIGLLEPENFDYQKDKVELLYRKARILDKQGSYKEAINFYDQTISLSGNLPFYFAPNAALQLGYLYQNIFKNRKLAIIYFKKALTYPIHEYKSSIDHKAKTALKQLSN